MTTDPWHYSRLPLAEQIVSLLASGLSSALVFFAPRRMGKTEFLLKDIQPLAQKQGWHTFYFSFLDTSSEAKIAFTIALEQFAAAIHAIPKGKKHQTIKKLDGKVMGFHAGIEWTDAKGAQMTMKAIMDQLAQKGKILLLMDEVQTLGKHVENKDFVAALRTALDIHKDHIKVLVKAYVKCFHRPMHPSSTLVKI